MLQKILLQDIYSHLSVWHYSQKFQWVLSFQACSKNSKCKCRISCFWQGLGVFLKRKERRILHTTTFVLMLGNQWFSTLWHNSSDTICYKNNNFGFSKWFPTFWEKKENYYSLLLFTCHYSPVTIHWYYSPLLFIPKFCLFKGGCPLYLSKCFLCLVQDFFFRESFSLRAFLCENILAYTSYLLYKACNL